MCLFISLSSHSKDITVPSPNSKNDERLNYFYDLMNLIIDDINLSKSVDNMFKLKKTRKRMNSLRIMNKLESGYIDILWSMNSEDREKKLKAIKIPIMKNLIGLRVCLILEKHKSSFYKKLKEKSYKSLRYVQGRGWPDVRHLRAANLDVVEGEYKNLFSMLRKRRADCFPRSILELDGEIKNKKLSYSIIAEDTFAIQYNTPMYFFVRKNNTKLHAEIERSLKKIIENGKFDKLFNRYYKDSLKKYNHKNRRIYKID